MQLIRIILFLLFTVATTAVFSQVEKRQLAGTSLLAPGKPDTTKPLTARITTPVTKKDTTVAKDTSVSIMKKKHDPHKATIRSAIIPGWGQAYNREYWKIPIVYGAIAIPVVTYFYNSSYYKKTKYAYEAVVAASNGDSSLLPGISPDVKTSSGQPLTATDYQSYRNIFRQGRDYSVLWFIILWGANIVDATVFGHLKDFDVSGDLSMHVEPTINSSTQTPGLSLVFNFKNTQHRPSPVLSLGK